MSVPIDLGFYLEMSRANLDIPPMSEGDPLLSGSNERCIPVGFEKKRVAA